MKKVLFFGSIMLLAACSKPAAEGELNTLIAERDSLKELRTALDAQIKLVEASIAEKDTTIKYDAVTAIAIQPGDFAHYFEVFGTVEADQSISLYPMASGKVARIHVKKGQKVRKGDLLVSLDAAILQSSLKELENGMELAKTVYEKQRKLWLDEQIGSELQYLQSKSNYDGLVQKLQTLKEQIELSEVRAPFDGTVDELFVKVGELAAPQMPVARIVNTSGVYVKADVPENYSNRIKVGTPANLDFSSMDLRLEAQVIQVGQFIQEGNRTFSINVSLPVKEGEVKPNQMVHVHLRDYQNDQALTVPTNLVQQDVEGNDFVYLIKETEAGAMVEKAMVESGYSYDGFTEISAGLKEGDVIVDKGSRSVRSGQRVEVK
jgi:RND family efflux transporter MFP subunit